MLGRVLAQGPTPSAAKKVEAVCSGQESKLLSLSAQDCNWLVWEKNCQSTDRLCAVPVRNALVAGAILVV